MNFLKHLWIIAALVLGAACQLSNAQPAAVAADTNSEADIEARFRQGFISKEEAIQERMMLENKKSLDIYGKVIDQYGQPVSDAPVEGSTLLNVSMVSSGGEVFHTTTDTNGKFSFIGIHGVKLGITPQKEGYLYNSKHTYQRPEQYQPDPNNPALVTMWRIRGPEPLVSQTIEAGIPYDGTPTRFDLSTGKQSTNGDMQITLVRFPLHRSPGLVHPYDWHFKIGIPAGGLAPENDLYPYWAPAEGYQPTFDFEISSNAVPWKNQLVQDFYIKDSRGQYGRMHIDLTTTSRTPETGIDIQLVVNPSGSQNLEPSP